MANLTKVTVASSEEMDASVQSYILRGFTVAVQTSSAVTMVKRKEFSIVMMLVGLLLFVLPLIIYLVVFALQKDEVVEIRLVADPAGLRLAQQDGAADPHQVSSLTSSLEAGPPPPPWMRGK